MISSVDDDSVPANARAWDFVMPPKSCSTFPLSSEQLICEIFQSQAANRVSPRIE
jgi:hypothetical protein